MNPKNKQTIKELHAEYYQKFQGERRQILQQRYKVLRDLYSWIIRHNAFGTNSTLSLPAPISKTKFSKLQQICSAFLDLLLKRKKQ